MEIKVTQEMKLAEVARARYGESAVEALCGALASICTDKQISILIREWSKNA